MKELEKRKCIIEACTNKFKVLPNDKNIACSNFCREEYSRKNGGREYLKTYRKIDRRNEKCRKDEPLDLFT